MAAEDGRKYEAIAKAIRDDIAAGVYRPGEKLPSENELTSSFNASRPTVGRALELLRREGVIETQTGVGSFVRGASPLSGQDRHHPGQGFLEVAEESMSAELLQAGIVRAPRRVTNLLELPEDTKAFLRSFLVSDDDGPTELVSAWFPLDLVRGTDLASPEPMSEGIRRHLQRRKGLRLDHAVERVVARRATAEEAGALGIEAGSPVLNLVVTGHDAEGAARQLMDAVLPGDRHELRDVYPLS